jgi:RimJ/RimL family protein N-acetyltransferase
MKAPSRDDSSRAPLVELRAIAERDLPALYEHQCQPLANAMAGFPARDRSGFMEHWQRVLTDDSVVARAILCDGELAGNIVGFEQAGERQVGYWVGQRFWSRGIATRALKLFLELVKERPLYAYVARQNLGSIRVLEKCGFRPVQLPDASDGGEEGEVAELKFRRS